MLRLCPALLIIALGSIAIGRAAEAPGAPKGRVIKVLPHLLDAEGRHTVSPSLFDRDAYQAYLRANPEEVSGIRYDVRWKVSGADSRAVTVQVELRGLVDGKEPRTKTLSASYEVESAMRRWTELSFSGEAFDGFGEVNAWRATVWCDGELLDDYRSFLW